MGNGGSLLAKFVGGDVHELSGYTVRQLPGIDLVVLDTVADELVGVLRAYGTLYEWARCQAQPQALKGRAPVYIATVKGASDCRVVIRHSWHGGLLAPLTGDRYRRPTRAGIELLNACRLHARAIPTPAVVAYALYAAGPGLARIDVATQYIPNANDFGWVLANAAPGGARVAAYQAVVLLLQQLAAHGFTHSDLNVKNILLHTPEETLVAAVLDVDVMQWNDSALPAQVMAVNTARLARSLSKAHRQRLLEFSDHERRDFLARLNSVVPAPPAVAARTSSALRP